MPRTTIDFGIDLGTTKSAIAVIDGIDARVIANRVGADVTPSAVWIDRRGSLHVGQEAKRRALLDDPENGALEFKLRMGLGAESKKVFARSGREMLPEELSAEVLKSLKADVQACMGEELRAAVICVPAAFEYSQTGATMKAAQLAGLTVSPLLLDPVAASLTYGLQTQSADAYWMVYDFGGGTFDAAVMRIRDGVIHVVSHDGDNFLGGKLIDWDIVTKKLIPSLSQQFNLPDFCRGNPAWANAVRMLKWDAETAKIEVCRTKRPYEIWREGLCKDADGKQVDVTFTLTPQDVEEISRPFIQRSVNLCHNALQQQGLSGSNLDRILMVGGTTLNPGVRQAVSAEFGDKLESGIDPITVVAQGAALFASTQTLPVDTSIQVPAGTWRIYVEHTPVGNVPDPHLCGLLIPPSGLSVEGTTIELTDTKTHWRSGRITPGADGVFEMQLFADEKRRCEYSIDLHDATGERIPTSPDRVVYTLGIIPGRPSAPHTIGVGLANGEMSPCIRKGTELPAQGWIDFETSTSVRAGNAEDVLRVSLIEGENARVAHNRTIGELVIKGSEIRRHLPAAIQIEMMITIDESQHICVQAYVPVLDQEFEMGFDPRMRHNLPDELHREAARQKVRVARARGNVGLTSAAKVKTILSRIEHEQLLEQIDSLVDESRNNAEVLPRLDRRLRDLTTAMDSVDEEESRRDMTDLIRMYGDVSAQECLRTLENENHRAIESGDPGLLRRYTEDLSELSWQVLWCKPEFHICRFRGLVERIQSMLDPERAAYLVEQGRRAIDDHDNTTLQTVIHELTEILPDGHSRFEMWPGLTSSSWTVEPSQVALKLDAEAASKLVQQMRSREAVQRLNEPTSAIEAAGHLSAGDTIIGGCPINISPASPKELTVPPQRGAEPLQFTVFRPQAVVPEKWYSILAFAHVSELPAEEPPCRPSPIEQVREQAERLLGKEIKSYGSIAADGLESVFRGDELMFMLEIEGFEVNPHQRVFQRTEAVHREEFRVYAPRDMNGRTGKGHFTVYRGLLVIAQISLAIRVDKLVADRPSTISRHTLNNYRKVFASYSHRDADIVDAFEQYAISVGDIYFRDIRTLRSGEEWSRRLEELITEADVFQLFWSHHSMRSVFVRSEWEFALRLGKPLRPVYWEVPFPEDRKSDLPPETLRQFHFSFLPVTVRVPHVRSCEEPMVPPAAVDADRHAAQSPSSPPEEAVIQMERRDHKLQNHLKGMVVTTSPSTRHARTCNMNRPGKIAAMISSTALDLPEHRKQVIEACIKAGVFPIGMEHLPARDVTGIRASLEMVDQADIYIGVYAWRYGWVPDFDNPGKISITEMEFNRALERKESGELKEVLIFLAHDEPPVLSKYMEMDAAAQAKLKKFKERASAGRVCGGFKSIEDLHGKVFHSVSEARLRIEGQTSTGRPIPRPPAFYAEPDYIGSHPFIGRQSELKVLSDWAMPADPTSVLLFEAIGGNGKSILTWEWTNNHATKVRPDWAGRFWYSFYERGAVMADFCQRALAYMTGQPLEELRKKKTAELRDPLLAQLHAKPWLLILDGLERVLVAYHRVDAAEVLDEEANRPTDKIVNRNPFDAIRDEDNDLLHALAAAAPSKILVSSRLTPRVLLNAAGLPIPGVRPIVLPGLEESDAENLFRSCGITGDSAAIRYYLKTNCDNHPLVIGVLAGLINDYLPDRGNFDAWSVDPDGGVQLDLASLDLVQRRNDILRAALAALSKESSQLLSTLALLSESVDYETLKAFNPHLPPEPEIVEKPEPPEQSWRWERMTDEEKADRQKDYEAAITRWMDYEKAVKAWLESPEFRKAPKKLTATVTDLERRGLLQYDRRTKRHDLHPVVRGVVAGATRTEEKERVGQRVVDYFSSMPHDPYEKAETLEDLHSGLTIVRTLLKLGHFHQAADAYIGDLSNAIMFNVEAYAEALSLLRLFFPTGWGDLPKSVSGWNAAYLVNQSAIVLASWGEPRDSLAAYGVALRLRMQDRDWHNTNVKLYSLSRRSLAALNLLAAAVRVDTLAIDLATVRGNHEDLFRSRLNLFADQSRLGHWAEAAATWRLLNPMGRTWSREVYWPGYAEELYAQFHFWQGTLKEEHLAEAERLAAKGNNRMSIRNLRRLRGDWYLEQDKWAQAVSSYQEALRLARERSLPDAASETGLALSKHHLLQLADPRREAERLAQARHPAHRLLAALWFAIGDHEQAKQHALAAYKWAWADGEPYVNRYELIKTTELLQQMNVPVPNLPPYDPSKDEPFPWEAGVRAAIEKLRAEKEAEKAEEN